MPRLATETVGGKGLLVEDVVSAASAMACPCMRGVEVSRAACVSSLPVSVAKRLVSVVPEAWDVMEEEADGLGLGALRAGLCVTASAVTVPDPRVVMPGVDERVDDMTAVDE